MELVEGLVHNKFLIKKHEIVNAIANVNLVVLCKAMMPKLHATWWLKDQLIAFVWVQQKMTPREAMNHQIWIVKKAEALAAKDGPQSFKFIAHLIAGVNTLLQQKQDQEDQDDNEN